MAEEYALIAVMASALVIGTPILIWAMSKLRI